MHNNCNDSTNTAEGGQYEPPAITTIGDLEALTHGTSTGNVTDAAFPAQTPPASFTFS